MTDSDTKNSAAALEAQHLDAAIRRIAPEGTATAVGLVAPSATFDAAEESLIANAVAARRDEFTTGRRLAREALARLGCAGVSLPADHDRVPNWPAGFVGSISHSDGICAALVGRSHGLLGIGLDIERITRLDAGVAALVCRPDERVQGRSNSTETFALTHFVAKEAFYKAYFPQARQFLDFHDVSVALDPENSGFAVRLVRPTSPSILGRRVFGGHVVSLSSHVLAVVCIARSDHSSAADGVAHSR